MGRGTGGGEKGEGSKDNRDSYAGLLVCKTRRDVSVDKSVQETCYGSTRQALALKLTFSARCYTNQCSLICISPYFY